MSDLNLDRILSSCCPLYQHPDQDFSTYKIESHCAAWEIQARALETVVDDNGVYDYTRFEIIGYKEIDI